jgi:hypothetical protein
MADEAIVVGAKDEASAILKKIEGQMQTLGDGIQKTAAETVQQGQRMEIALKGVAVAGAAITAVVAAVSAVAGVFTGAAASVTAFNEQEAAVNGLTTALQLQGVETEAAIARHTAFASQLQVATNVGDEATLGLMRQAAMMGVSDAALQDTTLAAVGLSQALGISVDESLKKVVQATNGNAAALGELIPAVRTAATEEERLAAVLAVAESGLADAQNQTETTAGVMARASGALGDLSEKIGAIIAPIQRAVSEGIAVLAEELQLSLQPAIDFVTEGMANLRPIIQSIVGSFQAFGVIIGVALETAVNLFNTLFAQLSGQIGSWQDWGEAIAAVVDYAAKAFIAGITIFEVAMMNLPATNKMVALQTELFFIGLVEDVKFALINAIPVYLEQFTGISQTWTKNLLTGMVAAMETLTEVLLMPWRKLLQMLPGILNGVLTAVSAAMKQINVNVEFAALTIGELPTAAGRQLTAREQELKAQIGVIATDIADQFNEKYEERVARLGLATRERLQRDIKLTARTVEEEAKTVAAAVTSEATKNVGSMTQSLSAVESRLLTRGSGNDPIQTVADNTRATVDAIKTLAPDIAAAFRQFMAGNQSLQVEVVA